MRAYFCLGNASTPRRDQSVYVLSESRRSCARRHNQFARCKDLATALYSIFRRCRLRLFRAERNANLRGLLSSTHLGKRHICHCTVQFHNVSVRRDVCSARLTSHSTVVPFSVPALEQRSWPSVCSDIFLRGMPMRGRNLGAYQSESTLLSSQGFPLARCACCRYLP